MPQEHQGPSAETLAKEAEMVSRFHAEDTAQRRLGFSLQSGKGRKNGSRAKAEARMQQKTVDSYANNPNKPHRWGQ
jgi:hypothetical protein